jgi:hypothetical protein
MTAPGVELIDLLASDVDLKRRKGEPSHAGERLESAQHSAVSSIYSTLSVLGLSERHPIRYDGRGVLRFVHAKGEPTGCGGIGEHGLNRARARPDELIAEVAKLIPEHFL